jgi:hypothetical protein
MNAPQLVDTAALRQHSPTRNPYWNSDTSFLLIFPTEFLPSSCKSRWLFCYSFAVTKIGKRGGA